jgi:hypothetical protein
VISRCATKRLVPTNEKYRPEADVPHEIEQRAKHMSHELLASIVSFEEDDEMVVFAFTLNAGESGEYVMLQYPLQSDEQDRCLRLDGLYIERNDQVFGCYHGVESIRRIGDRIEIGLNVEGKRRLKVERMVIAPVHWSPMIDKGLSRLAELSRGEYEVKVR